MSDLTKYIEKRNKINKNFKKMVDNEYENLKLGKMIKELRETKGMTQEELARKLKTTKSAISRLENHTENIRLITLEKVAYIFGKRLNINFR
jgi:ribosome-binding protein aMBF1 (putative translation factor)